MKYAAATTEVIKQLREIVGEPNVFSSLEETEKYSCDEMPLSKPHIPEVVVKPDRAQAVAGVLALANKRRIPVTTRGGGTGLSGGCVPLHGGIVLSTQRMNRIVEIDEHNMVAVVEAGVLLSDLHQTIEERGLYYAPYPGEKSATIGGTIATNAGGMRAVRYGVTRHHVLGLEVVLPSGEVLNLGGKFVKCSTGYDLVQLLVGSEGTLAVITKAIVKLTTTPPGQELLFIPFHSLEDALAAVPAIIKHKIVPVGIEFMERDIIEIVERYTERVLPYHEYPAFLMIIVEAGSEQALEEACQVVEETCKSHGAVEVFVPSSSRAKRQLLEAREKFYHAIKQVGPMDIADVVVPRSQIAQFVARVKEIGNDYGIRIVAYGHAGDGNVHLHPLKGTMNNEEWRKKLPGLFHQIYQVGLSFGGAISGEHGIGFEKKEYFQAFAPGSLVTLMKGVKKAFDPNGILNPGKIFDL